MNIWDFRKRSQVTNRSLIWIFKTVTTLEPTKYYNCIRQAWHMNSYLRPPEKICHEVQNWCIHTFIWTYRGHRYKEIESWEIIICKMSEVTKHQLHIWWDYHVLIWLADQLLHTITINWWMEIQIIKQYLLLKLRSCQTVTKDK
jgi:hypothetical protein